MQTAPPISETRVKRLTPSENIANAWYSAVTLRDYAVWSFGGALARPLSHLIGRPNASMAEGGSWRGQAQGPESGRRNLKIRTQLNAESNTAEVSVADCGSGIPEENLTSIFDAFFSTKPQGTGLGLPIAQTIINSYGGTIWAENRNHGAVFCFRLPLLRAS